MDPPERQAQSPTLGVRVDGDIAGSRNQGALVPGTAATEGGASPARESFAASGASPSREAMTSFGVGQSKGPLSDGGDAAGDDMTDMADTAGLEWKAGRGGGGGGREKQKGGGQVSTVGDAGAGGPTTPEVCFGAGSAVGGCGCWCNSSSTSYEVLGCRPWYMIHVAEPVVTAHRVSR